MDIEINSDGRSVKIMDINCEFHEDCMKLAVDLWRKAKPPVKPNDPKNRVGFIVESQP
jgi:hypothetical protein